MACVKSVNRSASVALSPEALSAEASYLAAGTMAGAVDLSFSTSAFIEIFKLDFKSEERELELVGQSTSAERFNRLSWGKNGSNSEKFSLGLIAGGLLDGNIGIWNPQALIDSNNNVDENPPFVAQLSRHKGPVRGMEFNAIAPNLLASGADEGEICIWDLASPSQPSHFPPLRGTGSAAQGEISYLSWNSKVQHILASTSYNGTTVVWDLKKQKPVISFSDSNRRRCSVLQWNPDIATQLVVASDDDDSPFLRLWDMRNIMLPVKEYVGHTKGVISMSWCPSNSSYLLSCAKDNRTICWDTVSGEIVCELPAGTNWNFDVHWYPKIPGVISASSFDGKIGLYNIEGCSRYGVGETDFGAAPLRAPKWYKRPAGVSFGFGGKLVSFHSRSSPTGAPVGSSEVYVHTLGTEDSLMSRSSEFEAAIQNGERASLRALCERKSEEPGSQDERETWGFLKVMFEDDGMARTKLLTHLGFNVPQEAKDTAENELTEQVNTFGLENVADNAGYAEEKQAAVFSYDNGEDFFNNLPSPKADTPVSTSGNNFDAGETISTDDHAQEEFDAHEESPDVAFADAVQRALVVGDYKCAVVQCIAANKMADALVIAHVGGASLWESTRDQYLKLSHSPYLRVVSAMVNHDLKSLVKTRPLKSWKETLALLCTFAQREEWTLLCDTLASKLMVAGNTLAATLCYICAGNIDKTVEIWSRSLSAEPEGKSYVDRLQDLMEKTIVFALATGQKRFSAGLCKLVEKYIEILASQGLLSTAMEYLKLLGEDLTPELLILRDRISHSREPVQEQAQGRPVYGADQSNYVATEASQHYYTETAQTQMQHTLPGSTYGDNYQQSLGSYSRSYPAPSPYQPAQQPQIFLPSQAPQVPQANFASAPVTTQPAIRPFVPAPPPVLRNAEQYQQPSTLGSQLYPGSTNPPYQSGPPGPGSFSPMVPQPGPVLGQKLPQVVAPTPTPRGFMPVTNSGVAQRPGMGSTQPSSPTQSSPAQPAVAPAAPPPTIQTVDTSNVPVHQRPVIATLTRLFNETSEALGGSRANAAKKREIEDNSRKLGALFSKLNSGDISKNAAEKLVQLCQALDNGDYGTALQIQVLLTTSEWDECNFWLATLKRMIKTRQNAR
ncbi:Protein transport protein Sec31B [Ancistrocladus abbreviatus]